MATKIGHCNCRSFFQDRNYGVGNRLFNETTSRSSLGWRCTVCGLEQSLKEMKLVSVDDNTENGKAKKKTKKKNKNGRK